MVEIVDHYKLKLRLSDGSDLDLSDHETREDAQSALESRFREIEDEQDALLVEQVWTGHRTRKASIIRIFIALDFEYQHDDEETPPDKSDTGKVRPQIMVATFETAVAASLRASTGAPPSPAT